MVQPAGLPLRSSCDRARAMILKQNRADTSSFWMTLSGEGRLPVMHFGMNGMLQVHSARSTSEPDITVLIGLDQGARTDMVSASTTRAAERGMATQGQWLIPVPKFVSKYTTSIIADRGSTPNCQSTLP